MSSPTAIIAIVPAAAAFILFFVVLFLKYRKKRDRVTLYFMLCFLCIGLSYCGWVTRSVFYPPDADAETVFFWFKSTYMVASPFCVFLALAAFEFLKPETIRKTGNLILFVAPIVFLEVWTFFSTPSIVIIAGQNDGIWPPVLSLGYAVIGGFYLVLINYVFIRFLLENPKHRLYAKVVLMEIGLIFFTSGTILEASKIGVGSVEAWGLFVRWFTASGALIMMYAYMKK
ncbi:MAG: hypothetical protein A7316_10160 [Candidatus Altiarchaeales archaeon WOR_SM1_86-2]|nr:MAG: hypothetical protein A7316_10160 [Candidatus Altiarchaeales archaeon WOR_SM1_86-2]ODS40904.1 MAG: hypothetical protein A7315_07305 [Candidatus Altiarchaeales archaeon WOR_SM1_79]